MWKTPIPCVCNIVVESLQGVTPKLAHKVSFYVGGMAHHGRGVELLTASQDFFTDPADTMGAGSRSRMGVFVSEFRKTRWI